MASSNNLRKVFRLLSLGFLVLALTFTPTLLSLHSPASESVSLEISLAKANAQTPEAQAPNAQAPEAEAEAEAEGGDSAQAPTGDEEDTEKIDATKMVMGVLAGLVLFLYGVTRLAQGLKTIAGDRPKRLLDKFTTNRFAGVLTGAAATTVLDSSSVTIIMVIAMVSAGLLGFAQSLAVVLGSNIGTTVGAQIIAFEINQYAPIALFIGLLLHFVGRTERQKNIGLILLGVGLIFFGLDTIDEAMKPFRTYQPFIDWMRTLGEHPLQGALVGALFTVLIQSSSATVAIIVTLAGSGLISLPAGIALMLGAEIGTCADTLVATIGRGRPALRTGVFHLVFNVVTATIGIAFAAQLAQLVESISSGAGVGRQIANAQIIFNVLGVLLFIGLIPLIARSLEKLVPDAKQSERQPVNV
ncbi:Na/Pi cotransporter family protein [Leptolyngbya sp. FACHB-261]|uniref:Na/Pi cotransporter family protein n=1 Tax=Leptolyngbya sp. FACHB-261 TaxID=2692806 RepID=UPI001684B2A0|nr:Na/Pi symporter [Leptolyngbya sp. FACHB-261]MBD2104992.1 Na/Pi cotransporter family protein [Leptolyngbya sp. FACHB-261]